MGKKAAMLIIKRAELIPAVVVDNSELVKMTENLRGEVDYWKNYSDEMKKRLAVVSKENAQLNIQLKNHQNQTQSNK